MFGVRDSRCISVSLTPNCFVVAYPYRYKKVGEKPGLVSLPQMRI